MTSSDIATHSIDIDAATAYIKANPTATPPTNKSDQNAIFAYYLAKAIIKSEKQTQLLGLTPYFTAFTFAALGCSLLHWPRRDRRQRFADISIWLICLALSWSQRPVVALLALNLAIGYLVWISVPASVPPRNLPSHETFMLSLNNEPQSRDSENEACMICWDADNPLATLPCKHQACKPCLQLIGNSGQTACPLCRKPLWQGDENFVFLLHRSRVALLAVNAVLYSVAVAYYWRRGEYWSALMPFALIWLTTALPLALVVRQIKVSGEDWWRDTQNPPGAVLKPAGLLFAATAFSTLERWMEISRFR